MKEMFFRYLLAIVFTASGFSALTYQVAWQRVLSQAIGSDAVSVVLIVAAFMAFLGVGAELARRLLRRKTKNIVFIYAIIEAGVGVYGIFSVYLIRSANAFMGEIGYGSLLFDAIFNLSILALPVIGMGMTTPLIVQCARRHLSDLGRVVGLYYGLNILGASFGAIATGLLLIELLGLFGTTLVAAAINILIAIMLMYYFRDSSWPEPFGSRKALRPYFARKIMLVAVFFGFCTLAVQIGLFRILSNYFTMSTIVFPVVLCVYLLLMAIGQWLGGRLADKYYESLPSLVCGLFLVGAFALVIALNLPVSWAADFGALRFTTFNGGLLESQYHHLIGDPNPLVVLAFSSFVLLVVLFWSSLFPVTLRLVTQSVDDAGEQFARLYMLYTLGNVGGAAIFGLFVLPTLGTGVAMSVTVIAGIIGVFLLTGRSKIGYGSIVMTMALVLLIPKNYYERFHLGDYQVDEVYEGVNGVVTTVETSRFYTIVDMNRTASASAIVHNPQPGDLYEAWRWNLTDLLVLDQSFRPQNILIIGIGHAYLIDALLDLPFVESIVVVDLSAEVVEAVRDNTRSSTMRVFTDPRVEIVIADGRRYVQQALASGVRFDLIQTKINEPWHAGSSNLFTVEFFEMQRDLLSEGGYLAVRPLAGHVRDALEVFPTAVYPGAYHVYFRNGAMERPTHALVTSDIEDLWFRTLPGRPERGERSETVPVTFFDSAEAFEDISRNTDDWPSFEYYYLRMLFDTWESPRVSLNSEDFSPWQSDIPVLIGSSN